MILERVLARYITECPSIWTFACDSVEAMDLKGKCYGIPDLIGTKLSSWPLDIISFPISTDFPALINRYLSLSYCQPWLERLNRDSGRQGVLQIPCRPLVTFAPLCILTGECFEFCRKCPKPALAPSLRLHQLQFVISSVLLPGLPGNVLFCLNFLFSSHAAIT